MQRRCFSLTALLVGMLENPAGATDVAVPPLQPLPSDWIVTLGADTRAVPLYPGSNQLEGALIPYFDRHAPQSPEKFHSPKDGAGFALYDNGVFAVGPVGSLIWERLQSDSPHLNGLGNVGYTLQLGGFVNYWVVEWLRARVEGLEGFGAADGVTANFALDAVLPLTPALTLSGGPRAVLVSSGAESPYFSITPFQSLASGLPVYNAGGGFQSFGAGMQLKYRFNPAWATYGFVEYNKLVGSTAASPIVAAVGGSSDQWTFGVGLTYSFLMRGLPF